MPSRSEVSRSVLVVVDVQPNFTKTIKSFEETLKRIHFAVKAAQTMGVPVVSTEQYPERMGGTEESLAALLPEPGFAKRAFSCCGCSAFTERLKELNRSQIHLVGAETHICVCQTALDLRTQGYEVFLPADAINGRLPEAHRVTLDRLARAGAVVTHTESMVYEWLDTSESDHFKPVLNLVKQYSDAS